MELKEFEEIVENMILQLSYPGFDPRLLTLALPAAANDAPVKLYAQALASENVHVQLSALRWFQNKSGAAKHHLKSITSLLENADPWVRKEAIKTIGIAKSFDPGVISVVCSLLKDQDQIVRVEAAKFLGNLAKEISKTSESNNSKASGLRETIIDSLRQASEDPILEVRRKAIKALRKLKAFSTF